MTTEEITEILSLSVKLLPIVISLISTISLIIKTSKELSDDDKAALLAIVSEMQQKVDELQPLE